MFHKYGHRFERQLRQHVPLCSLLIEEISSLAAPMACSALQQAPFGDNADCWVRKPSSSTTLDRGGRVEQRLSTCFKEAAVKRSMPMTSSRSSARNVGMGRCTAFAALCMSQARSQLQGGEAAVVILHIESQEGWQHCNHLDLGMSSGICRPEVDTVEFGKHILQRLRLVEGLQAVHLRFRMYCGTCEHDADPEDRLRRGAAESGAYVNVQAGRAGKESPGQQVERKCRAQCVAPAPSSAASGAGPGPCRRRRRRQSPAAAARRQSRPADGTSPQSML